ncbi:hypothetical protein [Echinimonas agarilytica]|uniref:Uncharacterized protein n=1 Tax=Echinimonas agarilytica TaxID=1215918 RepID=A0AA42B8U2_9GAMM|nr:hypothetical protein [Echinimonas agarilytica]MCM2680576.1 hypothetical protein [Echinimonas agarilytica]
MVLQILLVMALVFLLVLGAVILTCIWLSIWRGLVEMGRCNNTNRLGTDISFSDHHDESSPPVNRT